nr:hypothetical protein BaRGS_014670 [Batillaria attramentaria]
MGEFDFGINAVPNQVAALKLKSAALSDAGTYIVNVTYMTKTESGCEYSASVSYTAARRTTARVLKTDGQTDGQTDDCGYS